MSTELKIRETMELNAEVFSLTNRALVSCEDKNGNRKQVTIEASYWLKGQEKLSVLDDTAVSALRQANGGRYRAAFEIFAAEFKPIEKYMRDGGDSIGWANSRVFSKAVGYMLNRKPKAGAEFKGAKLVAITLAHAIANIPTFAHLKVVDETEVIENEAETRTE